MNKKQPTKAPANPKPESRWTVRISHRTWPVVFWCWAFLVTIWLFAFARTSVDTATPTSNRFSQLIINTFTMEQIDRAGNRVQVTSEYAYLDPKLNAFKLYEPRIIWQSASSDSIFSASGGMGTFAASGNSTELPSQFSEMELSDGAYATNGTMSVDSDRLIFDNENRIFYIPPGEFGWQHDRVSMPRQPTDGMYFDPMQGNGRMNPNLDELLAGRTAPETP